jgi:hypothetical protein
MSSTIFDQSVGDILGRTLVDADGSPLVVNPSREAIAELVSVLDEQGGDTRVRLLADERALKDVLDDFIVASTAADLVAEDALAIRTLETQPDNALVVTEGSVVALVAAGDAVAGLSTEEGDFVTAADDHYDEAWDGADEFALRTPPLSVVRDSLNEDISAETAADFDAVLTSLQTARGDGDGLDEVTISLLVAAKNDELLYDISKWGEDIGLASKATFSRTKTTLEDKGLLDTEKVPIDVGRPRLRLKLGDDRLTDADPDQLASVAQSILAS